MDPFSGSYGPEPRINPHPDLMHALWEARIFWLFVEPIIVPERLRKMSRRSFRRFNPNVPLVRGSRRPTDKELIYVSQQATTANVATTLKTATFPCTIVGLRWNMVFASTTAANNITNWIIVVVRDGNSANTISQSNGADMYTPEQDTTLFNSYRKTELRL